MTWNNIDNTMVTVWLVNKEGELTHSVETPILSDRATMKASEFPKFLSDEKLLKQDKLENVFNIDKLSEIL